jgi:hypothetical protein
MQRYACDGRRPLGWWKFEAPFEYPGRCCERSVLYTAGLLAEQEQAELLTWWRQEFEKAQAPNFWFCQGPGRFLEGTDARREHLRWADVPAELVEQWSAEFLETVAEHPARRSSVQVDGT